MITYRGDKFVRGKKFIIEEKEYVFVKESKGQLIFEAQNETIKLSRDDVRLKESM